MRLPIPRNIWLHRGYVENLEEFARAVYKTYPEIVVKFLNAVKEGRFKHKHYTIKDFCNENKINRITLDAIIRKLKAIGVIYKVGWHDFRFSSVFVKRLCKMMDFYAEYTGKKNPYQEVIEKYRILSDNKVIIKPDYKEGNV